MDTEQFLARVVPPGNYAVVTFKDPLKGGMGTRFFPRADLAAAAGFVRWASNKAMDTWFACASYTMATPSGVDQRGGTKFIGSRTHENVQAIRAFWIDIDVKRPGDGKDPAKVYASQGDAARWIGAFSKSLGIPNPNLWVNSGYGLHVYWILEDAMSRVDWQPYADAFHERLNASGALVDAGGFVSDSARILRPAGSVNMKDKAHPVPVEVLARLSRSDYPNALILQQLQPYVGQVQAKATGTHSGSAAALATGSVSPLFANRPQSNTAAAAQANLPASNRNYEFAEIAKKCLQVKMDLATNGAGVDRPIWYLGHLSLAHFCSDNAVMAHEIGKGDPRYTPAGTDAAMAQIAIEKAKGGGAPTCAYYNAQRPGVCTSCPWAGKLNSPLTLGVAGDGDLPEKYRRNNGMIQHMVPTKDNHIWVDIASGDVYAPRLTTHYQLKFTYDWAGKKHDVYVDHKKLLTQQGGSGAYFSDYGLTLDRVQAPLFGDFTVAWIQKLRELRVDLHDQLEPFGWLFDEAGNTRGIAVGGEVYRPDGTSEASLQAASGVSTYYQTAGTIAPWRAACDLITKGRVDLQMIVAAAFGAPLMRFTGQPGCTISVWSQGSARGKSSAFKVGQTVWGTPAGMCGTTDTVNSVRTKVGAARFLPCYWDEIKIDKSKPDGTVNFFFDLAQGKDKGRLDASAQLRATNTWQTLFLCSGNRPVIEYIKQTYPNSEAGEVRCLEIELDHPKIKLNTSVSEMLAKCDTNYGHAGRIYAKYLIENEAKVEAFLKKLHKRIEKDLNADANERFFVAAAATIVAGAMLATQAGIVNFDTKALLIYMEQKILSLRGDRATSISNNGKTDLDELFGQFHAWASPRRLTTTHFNRPGVSVPPNKNFIIEAPAVVNQHVVIHVGVRDQKMRIERNTFETWCQSHNFSGAVIVRDMELAWGATTGRSIIGAGTPYKTGNVRYIELPLIHPDLAGYLDPQQQQSAGTTVGAGIPAKGLAGNQAKV